MGLFMRFLAINFLISYRNEFPHVIKTAESVTLLESQEMELESCVHNATDSCNDKWGSQCIDSKCRCREENPVDVDGVCLQKQTLAKGCWVTAQCSAPDSACRRPSGRILFSIHEDLWAAYIRSNLSAKFVPGICDCNDGFMMRSVRSVQSTDGEGELVCVARAIGSPCRTNYECGMRTHFSGCSNKKCACIAPHYVYDRASDRCVPADRIECGKSSCPHLWSLGAYGEFCFYGFSASMSVVLLIWLSFCGISRSGVSTDSQPPDYELIPFTGLVPQETRATEDPATDDEPPSYESTILKRATEMA